MQFSSSSSILLWAARVGWLASFTYFAIGCSPAGAPMSTGRESPPPYADADAGGPTAPPPGTPPSSTPDASTPSAPAISSEVCDTSLTMSGSAEDAARAMGLCHFADEASGEWGVLSARFTTADGAGTPDSMEQIGILPTFGSVAPRQGSALLALSSGTARAPGQPGYTSDCDSFDPDFEPPPAGYPPGYPITSPSCPGTPAGAPFNAVALEVRVRAPEGARSFSFASAFFTYEYPDFICTEYNDFFVALRDTGSGFENIAFDEDENPVSVNNSLLRACSPGTHGGKTFDCPLGRSFLSGTGYDGSDSCGHDPSGGSSPDIGASTGWLRTTAPVSGGEIITLRFAIWDSSDGDLDSLVLIDDFRWEVEEAPVETTPDLI